MEYSGTHFPAMTLSANDLAQRGIRLDPLELHKTMVGMWANIAGGQTPGKKSVLCPPEEEFWASRDHAMLRRHFEDERLGWKLSTLSAVGQRYASVKIVGANAANRFRGFPRSCSTIMLLDKFTMRPACLLEGTHISAARTATYASLIGERLAAQRGMLKVFLFGGGPVAHAIASALQAVLGEHLGTLWVKTRSPESASIFVNSLRQAVPTVEVATSLSDIRLADLVITATNARYPVFAGSEPADQAVVLHLGGDETPADYLSHALEHGTVVCDDLATVSARNSQSLSLYFSRRGLSLEGDGPAMGILDLAHFLHGAPTRPGPLHLTCVGLPCLDLYAAEYLYNAFLAAGGAKRQEAKTVKPEPSE